MPTIERIDGWRVVVYPNDHRPAHVHVIGAGCEAVFELDCPHGPPRLRESWGFSLKDINRVEKFLRKAVKSLCIAWEQIHGNL